MAGKSGLKSSSRPKNNHQPDTVPRRKRIWGLRTHSKNERPPTQHELALFFFLGVALFVSMFIVLPLKFM